MDDIDSFLGTANPKDFAQVYGPAAAKAGKELGVDPKILLGQWGEETAWGKKVIPGTNNLGNVKDVSGSGVIAKDNQTGSTDKYRKFDSPDDFADHYVHLIKTKYSGAVDAGSDAGKFAKALKSGGYAEDKDYVPKLVAAHNTVSSASGGKTPVSNDDIDSFLGPEPTHKSPTVTKDSSWFDRAKAAEETNPQSGLAQGGRIVDAAKQVFTDAKSNPGFIPALGPVGIGEAALQMGTGLGSSIVGGLAGLGSMGKSMVGSQITSGLHNPLKDLDDSVARAATLSQHIQNAGTYQPRTGVGKLISEAASVPLNAAKEMTGSMAGDVGQLVNGQSGRNVGQAIGGIVPDVAATLMGGAGALKGARTIADLPHDAIPGRDFSPLRDLTPEKQARYKALTDQGVKPTLGQITRDPEQWRFEEQTGAQKSGASLRDRQQETEKVLLQAVADADKESKGVRTTKTESQTGRDVSTTLENKAKAAKANINQLYKDARDSGETKQLVDTKPLEKYLDDEAEAHRSVKVIQAKLQRMKDENGGKLTVDDAETLYRAASDQTTYGDPSSVYMGRVKSRINEMTEGVGGDKYRAARAARLAYGMEFEDRAGIARLIDKKKGSRTDYKTATEDVFKKTMVNGSDEELRDVIRSLKDIDVKKDTSGVQALRNLQGQTVDHIFDGALRLSGDEKGISAYGLEKAIDQIGREKITDLLGPKALKKLEDTLSAAKLVKDKPGRVAGSDTGQNLRDFAKELVMDEGKKHILGSVPVVGNALKAVSGYAAEKAAERAAQARAFEALNPRKASPQTVKQLMRDAKDKQAAVRNRALSITAKGTAPAAYAGSNSSQRSLAELMDGTN